MKKKTKLKPNRKQKKYQKSNKLRSNQAVFMVGVSRYLIAVDSWLRSRHHHRYLCRRPLSSAAHHCHHHCTYLHKHLYNAPALALALLSLPLTLFVVHFLFVFQHYSCSLTFDHHAQHVKLSFLLSLSVCCCSLKALCV